MLFFTVPWVGLCRAETSALRLNTCDFVCGTMSRAKSPLHWSVIHYQVTLELHSEHGSETSILAHQTGISAFLTHVREIHLTYPVPSHGKDKNRTAAR